MAIETVKTDGLIIQIVRLSGREFQRVTTATRDQKATRRRSELYYTRA